jgi:Fur family ferric uptake transcriptional regulator
MSKGRRAAQIEDLKARLERYMADHGLRSTSQRRVVTDVFFQSEGHYSIEELLAKVREEDPKVGYATVYRTLKLLKESGLANERHFGDGFTRYEVAIEDDHHDHLICLDCDAVIEFENDAIEHLQEEQAQKLGFELKHHRLELFARCHRPGCPNKKAKRP